MKHIVGFSGGIDSQACARWVLNRYPKEDVILLNSDAGGNEDKVTQEFVMAYSRTIHPVITIPALVSDIWADGSNRAIERGYNPSEILTFERMLEIKRRPPSGTARFCTTILKLKPQVRWMQEQFGPKGPYAGEDYERYTGVRRDESKGRAKTPDREWDKYFDCWVNHVVAGWTKKECFDYCVGEPVNELYRLGFTRVGCSPCVFWSKEDIQTWAARRPDGLLRIQGIEARTGVTFFPPTIPKTSKELSVNPQDSIGEVVQWAKTSRGGRQQLFPILHEREACESKYGLCE